MEAAGQTTRCTLNRGRLKLKLTLGSRRCYGWHAKQVLDGSQALGDQWLGGGRLGNSGGGC